jgi:hypothetical protein
MVLDRLWYTVQTVLLGAVRCHVPARPAVELQLQVGSCRLWEIVCMFMFDWSALL